MRERVTVVTLSVCQSVSPSLSDFGEGAIFRVETYIRTFKSGVADPFPFLEDGERVWHTPIGALVLACTQFRVQAGK